MKMIRIFSTVLLMALVIVGFMSSMPAEAKGRSDTETIVEGNTAFMLDLYGKLKEKQGNLFFSPFSISTALAMTYAGACENTERQMAKVLNFPLDQKRLHPAFADLEAQLNALQEKEDIELSVANALWAQRDYVFLREYLDLIERNYGGTLYHVDFKKALEVTREKINTWVEQKTNDKIKDLIKSGILDARTRLVLTNAIYFKGKWASQFKKSQTRQGPFRLAPGKSVDVSMMNQKQKFRYMENDCLQILEMPYADNDLSIIVLLPKEVHGLVQLESALGIKNLNSWMGRLREVEIFVTLPKFKVTSQFRLDKTLASMGMPDAFDRTADFSGMDGTKMLFISAVIHKAFVDVNEEGTEAAAATAVAIGLTSVSVSPPVFRADHPFLFLIRHNPSGSILFFGRVVDPTV